jgi:protein TonB
MTKRASTLILLVAISLTGTILAIAIPATPPLISLSEGKDPVNQTRSIRISLAERKPEQAPSETARPKEEPIPEPEEKPEPEPEPEPEPVSVPIPAEETSKSETSAKTKSPAEPTPQSATEVDLLAGASQTTDTYLSKLVRHLSAYREYPRRARRLNMEGTPVVIFEFSRAGELLDYQLLQSAPYTLLNEAALDMLKVASPFPAVPDDMAGETFQFQLPVRFQLR